MSDGLLGELLGTQLDPQSEEVKIGKYS